MEACYWKDGNLDPVDANGWKRTGDKIKPQLSRLTDEAIELLERMQVKVVDSAAWFELLGKVSGKKERFFRIGDGERLKSNIYKATQDGNLSFLANDAKTWLTDKYDNNQGWMIVPMKRVS